MSRSTSLKVQKIRDDGFGVTIGHMGTEHVLSLEDLRELHSIIAMTLHFEGAGRAGAAVDEEEQVRLKAGREAAAQAIWETWCASPAGREAAPDGGVLNWGELVLAAESGKRPALAEIVALSRLEADNAIIAFTGRAGK